MPNAIHLIAASDQGATQGATNVVSFFFAFFSHGFIQLIITWTFCWHAYFFVSLGKIPRHQVMLMAPIVRLLGINHRGPTLRQLPSNPRHEPQTHSSLMPQEASMDGLAESQDFFQSVFNEEKILWSTVILKFQHVFFCENNNGKDSPVSMTKAKLLEMRMLSWNWSGVWVWTISTLVLWLHCVTISAAAAILWGSWMHKHCVHWLICGQQFSCSWSSHAAIDPCIRTAPHDLHHTSSAQILLE